MMVRLLGHSTAGHGKGVDGVTGTHSYCGQVI